MLATVSTQPAQGRGEQASTLQLLHINHHLHRFLRPSDDCLCVICAAQSGKWSQSLATDRQRIEVSATHVGLDARAANIVMRVVRNVADTGRTIVCTIHQPAIDIFEVPCPARVSLRLCLCSLLLPQRS